MKKQFTVNGNSYLGTTYPSPVKSGGFGLERYNIKLVPYVQDFERGEKKCFKEAHYKEWIKGIDQQGVYVPLWKGKGKITTVQVNYAQMDIIGVLLLKTPDLMDMFKAKKLDRPLKLKGRSYIDSILKGHRKDHKDGFLAHLNHSTWNVDILDHNDLIVFSETGLAEHEASLLMSTEVRRLQGAKNA